jgi:transposase-like protein
MPRLTEVQRGQAIALQMQGQRQQQVALQFGVNVSTIERLVRRLRDTGRVADRPLTNLILLFCTCYLLFITFSMSHDTFHG